MGFISNLSRRLAVLGVVVFFLALVVFLVIYLVQNPVVLNRVTSAVNQMISDVVALARGQ